MIKTKRKKTGPVGVMPDDEGSWRANKSYPLLKEVQHNHDSWISKVNDNIGHEPVDGSAYWFRSTNGGQHAYEAGEDAELQAGLAEIKGNRAEVQGDTAEAQGNEAERQGNYAKGQGDRAKLMADHRDQLRDNGYIYRYDPENEGAGADGYYKTDEFINADLDITKLTQEQKESLIEQIKESLVFATEAECRNIVSSYGS